MTALDGLRDAQETQRGNPGGFGVGNAFEHNVQYVHIIYYYYIIEPNDESTTL